MKITKRLDRAIKESERVLLDKEYDIAYPIDLLYAIFKDESGLIEELFEELNPSMKEIERKLDHLERKSEFHNHELFGIEISSTLDIVLNDAKDYMNRYGQVYLNIGHIIKAICRCDNYSTSIFTPEEVSLLLKLTTESRDLYVKLNNNEKLEDEVKCDYQIHRGTMNELDRVVKFVLSEFNLNWAKNVEKRFLEDNISIFYVTDEEEIIGFGAFNVIADGVFGPMGVSKNYRSRNIGSKIVKTILCDMKDKKYEKVVIDDAGPIEFYERVCNAHHISK